MLLRIRASTRGTGRGASYKVNQCNATYLTGGEAVAYLRTTIHGIYALVKRRKLHPLLGRPGPLIFLGEALDKYLSSRYRRLRKRPRFREIRGFSLETSYYCKWSRSTLVVLGGSSGTGRKGDRLLRDAPKQLEEVADNFRVF